MELYRSSSTLDEESRREIGPLFWSRRRSCLHWCAAAAMGILALAAAIGGAYPYALLSLLFAARSIPTRGMRRWSCERTIGTRLYGASSFSHVESFFTEAGICVHDLTTAGRSTIDYRSIRQAAETEHYFLLRTRTGRYVLVDKRSLSPEERRTFLPFLKGKCPGLKAPA